jgi:hypothetical protein
MDSIEEIVVQPDNSPVRRFTGHGDQRACARAVHCSPDDTPTTSKEEARLTHPIALQRTSAAALALSRSCAGRVRWSGRRFLATDEARKCALQDAILRGTGGAIDIAIEQF